MTTPLRGVFCLEVGIGSLDPAGFELTDPFLTVPSSDGFWKRLLDTLDWRKRFSTEVLRLEGDDFNSEGLLFSCNLSCQKLRGDAPVLFGVLYGLGKGEEDGMSSSYNVSCCRRLATRSYKQLCTLSIASIEIPLNNCCCCVYLR